MAKVTPISHSEVRKRLLNTPEAIQAYVEATEEYELLEQLTEWREKAGLKKIDIAKRMGINPSAVTRIEKNVTKASWHTLKRYAAACGVELSLTAK
ncbi:helix-turn-helix domain-containing protein [Photorhabdus laumondii subsp. laumondii]|uniref:Photorhabdus luminescens subsp. laumondii TTO1 complete genome segment 16/17 n=6 Tax=Photorhabdus TaxID=29487 RepID=Q7MYZ8_PHOLL|nr:MULTISPECIES: helix-turn-helix transcriptional regulator [Photorhabdus]PQQ38885.1 XRE family transcriptional regulator [Photorhabdus luminescens]AWK44043.1 transcriptional regulator [Photorhabdus laumondii subsp. laumondii]AXG44721.1 XRE family transcriptional regulator [Photorhabdus laumondii subsp. laumondii]AXG49359.1 XRE family transcriptional regulator [Photorhabdus laumondii subsp. laumondii]MBS9428196.1 XRE family transcriptional regulator [Photorhabdus akhurstii]